MSAELLSLPLTHFTSWLAYGERGLSSEAIVSHLTGSDVGRNWGGESYRYRHHPHDPADFRRCQLLLEHVPLAKLAFPAMRTASPEWARLVDAWDEIHEAILSDVPDYMGRWTTGNATKGYRLMRRVIAGGTVCATCDGSGYGDECPKCKGTGRRTSGRCRARGCWRGHHLCATCHGDGYIRPAPEAAS